MRQVVYNLQHQKGPHPDAHRGAAVLLLRAQLRTFLRQCHKLQKPHEDTHGSEWTADSSVQMFLLLRIRTWTEASPLSPQVRSRMCAQCLAARSASQNTPASTSTTWSTRLANPITATTVGRPISRSQPSPCTNAPPTTTQSPSKRSRRPTSNPPPVSAGVMVTWAWWRAMLSVIWMFCKDRATSACLPLEIVNSNLIDVYLWEHDADMILMRIF